MKQWIIFTDLDGTLLDAKTYSFAHALPALRLLGDMNIPLVLCSSKTRSEMVYYREKLANTHPFISENGGGIFMPKNYFQLEDDYHRFNIVLGEGYEIVVLGAPYNELRKAMRELRAEGFKMRGFGDMTAEEISGLTGLALHEAAMARERDFDEPFCHNGDDAALHTLLARIVSKGFHYTQGRFFHILGNSDKGKAVSILTDFYRRKYGDVATIAIGDSPNDIPMLEQVDYPVLVQNPEGGYDQRIQLPNLIKAEGAGPEGWNHAVLSLFQRALPSTGL